MNASAEKKAQVQWKFLFFEILNISSDRLDAVPTAGRNKKIH